MTIKIEKKIVGFEVAPEEDNTTENPTAASTEIAGQDAVVAGQQENTPSNVVHMHEKVERPEMLLGSTYKVKTPLSEHALYVTINDIVLNPGTAYEKRRPFEIFINSKNMDHFQWIVALTRIISAVFRKGGDVTFLVEELHSVFDPRGGYFKKGGRYMPSLVGEIGDAIENHLRMIGMIAPDVLDESRKQHIEAKRREYEAISEQEGAENGRDTEGGSHFPAASKLCGKCHTKAMIKMDGCMTCLNCGDSKCG